MGPSRTDRTRLDRTSHQGAPRCRGAMRHLAGRTVILILALGVLGGCGAPGRASSLTTTSPNTTPTAVTTGPASSRPGCQPAAHLVCVLASDNGRVVRASVGDTVRVYLTSADHTWSALVQGSPRLLRPSSSQVPAAGGVDVTYLAIAPGQTSLQASERPKCPRGQACPQYVLLWRVEVRISR